MFDLGWGELLVIAIIAILVVGPKELPKFVKTIADGFGKVRRMAAHFQAGVDEMIRQSELDDLRKDLQTIRRETARPIFPPGNTIHTTPPPSKMVATSAAEIVDAEGSGPQLPAEPERSYTEPPPPPPLDVSEPEAASEPAKSG